MNRRRHACNCGDIRKYIAIQNHGKNNRMQTKHNKITLKKILSALNSTLFSFNYNREQFNVPNNLFYSLYALSGGDLISTKVNTKQTCLLCTHLFAHV